MFELLPERMGLVLSGAPSGFSLPENDPHYLEIDLDDMEPPAGDTKIYRYQFGALTSDRPSDDDRLGVQRYADALAQFARHPERLRLPSRSTAPGAREIYLHAAREQSLLRDAAAAAGGLIVEVPFDANGQPRRPDRVGRRAWKRALRGVEERVVTVGFNAWRFQDSTQIWAGLASVITSRLEAALPCGAAS